MNYNEKTDSFDQENLHKEVEFQNQIEQCSINEDEQCAAHKIKMRLHCTSLSPSRSNENTKIPTTSSNTVNCIQQELQTVKASNQELLQVS